MSGIFELEAKVRSDIGKGASRRLRRKADLIPAIIYGANQEPSLISLAHNKVIRALENESFYSRILTLKIDEKTEQVILKDLQRHPYKRKILHMDFLRIKADEELIMHVPLHFINEDVCAGVKIEGGVISHLLNEVSISCLPADLPEFITVDMAECHLNDTIHISNLKLPKGVKLTAKIEEDDETDLPIARVTQPRVAEEIEATAPEASETEVTTAKASETEEAKAEKKE